MSNITGVRSAGIDNVYYIVIDGKEMLATSTDIANVDAFTYNGAAYRLWSPSTSKLASMITKGMKIPLYKDSRVLYLGAASGTTVSHVSDIVTDGIVYAVEFAPRPARDLLDAISGRENVIPIIADARQPAMYPPYIDHVDCIYQDVAQPDQSKIAIANADRYLMDGGWLAMAIKGRSISVSEDLDKVFEKEVDMLKGRFQVVQAISLEPLHKDHKAVLCKYSP
jgi:fibrillarin-like pre-rRNA processing protein